MERVRKVSHYITLPVTLTDTPIPMARFKYQPVNEEGEPEGVEIYHTINELYLNPRKSVDGTHMIIGLELDNLMNAFAEFGAFEHAAELQILSHSEAVALMRTPEWTAEDMV